jgi:hypothetical protein
MLAQATALPLPKRIALEMRARERQAVTKRWRATDAGIAWTVSEPLQTLGEADDFYARRASDYDAGVHSVKSCAALRIQRRFRLVNQMRRERALNALST